MTTLEQLLQPAPDLEPWQAQLGPLRLGPGTPYEWATLDGVDELPDLRTDDEPRPWSHGVWSGDDWSGARTIGWTVEIMADAGVTYEQALADYRRVMVPAKGQERVPLWVNVPQRGAMVRWDVKVRRHRVTVDQAYELGLAVAEAQLSAPDPIGYGAGQSVSTGFPVEGGGLEFDLFTDGAADTGFLEFGAAGSSGRVELVNPGTAESWPVHRIDGPTPSAGFDIVDVATGKRLRFVGPVPAGSQLTIDTATGSVILDDVADRSRQLVRREWTPIPPGGRATLAFVPLSTITEATLTTAFAPAWW